MVIDHFTEEYLGSDAFEGGCSFLNMLVELAGQSESMIQRILKGYVRFARLAAGDRREGRA